MRRKKMNPENNATTESDSDKTPTELEVLEQRIAELELGLKEQEDKYTRLYAEFENYRKRSIREKADYLSAASQDMIVALLPVLDDFERAVANNAKIEDTALLKNGFSLIFNKVHQILEAKGLKSMETLNQDFNYELHEAIANVPTENDEQKGKVMDQVEKGYFLNDKVIRYAKVVVGQ
ncbi:MAG: nucleotide exchange factor GrpE [Bacteroidetes bacterium]|nr:nucleotide exchange factor GrpE [Bacteroidota bacterium]MBM3424341.1 nucleotide exchange factor GrpE [Bacteroidota bacterium]